MAFVVIGSFVSGVLGEWYNIWVSYFLKDDLKLTAANGQMLQVLMQLASQLRIVCGLISDRFSILGSHRHSWYLLASLAAAACQLLLLLVKSDESDHTVQFMLLFLLNVFGNVWVYVLTMAIIASYAKNDPEAGAETLVAMQNGFWGAGMMVGDFTAGRIYAYFCSARTCFAFNSALYVVIGFMPFLLEDKSAKPGSTVARIQQEMAVIANSVISCCSSRRRATTVPAVAGAAPAQAGCVGSSAEGSASTPEDDGAIESPDSCWRQCQLIWETLNPYGPTRGMLLRAIVYIVLCIAVIPDFYCKLHCHTLQRPAAEYACVYAPCPLLNDGT